MIKKCVLAICISFLLISKASATKFHSFSAEIGATAESIDFTTYDSKFSGEENLSNLAVAAKVGWRNDSAPWPPFEGRFFEKEIIVYSDRTCRIWIIVCLNI